jgi:hypothetical protein
MGVWAERSVSGMVGKGLYLCINGIRARQDFAQESIVGCVEIVVVQFVAGRLTHQEAATQVIVRNVDRLHDDRSKAGFHRGTVGRHGHGVRVESARCAARPHRGPAGRCIRLRKRSFKPWRFIKAFFNMIDP